MLKTFFGKKDRSNKGAASANTAEASVDTSNTANKGAASADTSNTANTMIADTLRNTPINKNNMGKALDALEEFLIVSDAGMEMALSVVSHLRADISSGNINNMLTFVEELNTNLLALLAPSTTPPTDNANGAGNGAEEFSLLQTGTDANGDANGDARTANATPSTANATPSTANATPSVVMFVGVNGVGKTTSVAKVAYYAKGNLGKRVLIAAGDTYRAAAVEQLQHWGEVIGVDVVSQQQGADSAAVMYDALSKGIATGADILLCDTSGRLQNNDNLMRELEKSARVLKKLSPNAPHHVFLVLDATLGSNSISQAQVFADYISPTGVILTKTDAQLQPGSLFQIVHALGLPIRYVSYGEGMDQLSPFQPYAFVGDFITGFLETYAPSGR